MENQTNTMDKTVMIRTAILGAVTSWLLVQLGKLPFIDASNEQLVPAIGFLVGGLYDWVAYMLKSWIKEIRDFNPPVGLAVAIAFCLVAGPAVAQSGGIGYVYEPSTKQAAKVATTELTTLKNVLGRGWSVPVLGFAGVGARGRAVTGLTAVWRKKIADGLTAELGPAVLVDLDRPRGVSVYFGASWRF